VVDGGAAAAGEAGWALGDDEVWVAARDEHDDESDVEGLGAAAVDDDEDDGAAVAKLGDESW
jgi:hypothetical protein